MSDNAQRRAAERFESDAERIEFEAVTALMSKVSGRSWMADLLGTFGVFQSPFTSAGAEQTSFNCGMHNAGLILLNAVTTHTPEQYLLMLKEREELNDRVERNDAKRSDDDDGTID